MPASQPMQTPVLENLSSSHNVQVLEPHRLYGISKSVGNDNLSTYRDKAALESISKKTVFKTNERYQSSSNYIHERFFFFNTHLGIITLLTSLNATPGM